MRVLIAEDELISLKIVESALKNVSDPDFALDGQEAFRKFKEAFDAGKRYDLICLDVNMPREDGLDCLARIREYEEKKGVVGEACVKVLMVSGVTDPVSVCDATSLGCTAYLTKPLNTAKFKNEVTRLG